MAGWVYLASLIITLAAVTLALQVTLPQISSAFQLVGDSEDRADAAKNAVILGCLLIAFSTAVNSIGVGLLAKLNNIGVFAELVGVVLLIVLLATRGVRGPQVVCDVQGRGTGFAYFGPFMAAMIMASYVMYGFDTAGSLAEETLNPRRTAPRAILQALTAAAAAGALLLLFALMAANDLNAPELGVPSGGFPFIVTSTLGEGLGKVFLCDVIIAITACTLAVHTGAVRLMFSMARDNQLPFGRILARVSETSRLPLVPALLTGTLAALALVENVNSPKLIDAVIPVAIVWANLAYLLVTTPLLVRRLRGWPGPDTEVRFSLGRWGLLVNIAAVVWGILTVVNMSWPRPESDDDPWHESYAALLFTGILVILGGGYYVFVRRWKSDALPEHRAEQEAAADAPRPRCGGGGHTK
jgi:urea carboxylase system permease